MDTSSATIRRVGDAREMGKGTLLALLAETREGPGGAGSNSGVSVLELNCHVSILDFPIAGGEKEKLEG